MNAFSSAEKPSSATRRERNKAEKLDRIQRAARDLFGRKGFERTSIGEIARAADVAVGTIFLYAKSKEDLLVTCFRDEVGEAMREGFRTVRGATLLEQVLHVFGVMIAHNAENVDLARVFTREIPFAEAATRRGVREVMAEFHDDMGRLIERAQLAREVRADVSPAALSHNLFALYFNFLLRWLGGERRAPDTLEPGLRAMIELQLRGVRPAMSRRAPPRRRIGRKR